MTRQEIERQRRLGYSLNELAFLSGIPKSTIQGWVRSVHLNWAARQRLENRIRTGGARGRTKRRIKLPDAVYRDNYDLLIMTRFIAHSLFDGSVYRDRIVYYSSHLVLAQQFADDGNRLFRLKPRWLITEEGVYRVIFYSRNLVDYVKTQQARLLARERGMNPHEQLILLQAFFDDEGSVAFSIKSGKRKVRGYQKDQRIIRLIRQLLIEHGIEAGTENLNHCPEIVISRRENLERFAEKINFTPGVCFRALRSNSIYRIPTEKREVLKRALDSYQKTRISQCA